MPPAATPDAIRTAVDVLTGRALDVRNRFAVWEVERYGREWTTSDLASGLVVDVGDLVRLVQAAEGVRSMEDVAARLAHELADCLWSVLVLADRLDVDLGASFAATMDDLESRLV